MVPGSSLGRLQHCDGKFVHESADVNPRAACDQREGSRTIKKKALAAARAGSRRDLGGNFVRGVSFRPPLQ